MKILKEAETNSGIWVPDSSSIGQDITNGTTKETIEEIIEKRLNDTSKDYTDEQLKSDVKALLKSWGAKE